MNLNAYWDQFFDRESGVFFYQYLVGTSCAEKNDFNLNLTATNVCLYLKSCENANTCKQENLDTES